MGCDLPTPGKTVLDLGAHVGWFTLWCLDHGASKIIAVEASPKSYRYHLGNFKNDDRVTSIHAAAVSEEIYQNSNGGTLNYVIAPNSNNWRNCVKEQAYWKNSSSLTSITVPCLSVQRLLAEHPGIHTVKIDIEGSEMDVLESVEWPVSVQYIVFEYSIGTRSCKQDCTGSVGTGCALTCAKVRYPGIQDNLEAQGFEVNVPGGQESFNTYVTGERVVGPYDKIIFCRRIGGGRFGELAKLANLARKAREAREAREVHIQQNSSAVQGNQCVPGTYIAGSV